MSMTKNKRYLLLPTLLAMLVLVVSILSIPVGATSVDMLDGKVNVTDTQNTLSNSGGTLTATAKGSITSKKTNTVTLTNKSGSTATVSFDYSADKANSFTIDGVSAATSGSYSKLLANNATITLAIQSKNG